MLSLSRKSLRLNLDRFLQALRLPKRRSSALEPLESLEGRIAPSVFTVTTTANAGAGSLRDAILQSNKTVGPNTINFSIGNAVEVIQPTAALDPILQPVTIDGSAPQAFPGQVIRLDGNAAGAAYGLTVSAGNSLITNLTVTRFANTGIELDTAGGDKIQSCIIGTDNTMSSGASNPATYGRFKTSQGTKASSIRCFLLYCYAERRTTDSFPLLVGAVDGPPLLREQRRWLAGVQGAAMSPLVVARTRRNVFCMDAAFSRLPCGVRAEGRIGCF